MISAHIIHKIAGDFMSKTIIIDEAGLPKALTVDALRTSKQGGGSEDWLPEDETNLVELDIGGSGTYRASDYGAYGISVARVTPKYGGGATSKAAQQPVFANLHTPAIREGGNPKYMGARLLKTNLQGGGTCLWVPEDEVNLESKYVDHSGTYPASADNCYGYSQVTVSGVDVEITQDEDGDDVAKITDGGETREEKLPSSIQVTTLPNKTVYINGETIDYTGMIVTAYTNSGRVWSDAGHPNGVIPLRELILPKTIAELDFPSALSPYDISPLPNPLSFCEGSTEQSGEQYAGNLHYVYTYRITPVSGKTVRYICIRFSDHDLKRSLWASDESGPAATVFYERIRTNDGYVTNHETKFANTGTPYTYGGKTVYYKDGGNILIGGTYDTTDAVPTYIVPSQYDDVYGPAAWAMIYGEISGGSMSVPVQWKRPYDGRLLETSFDITGTGGTP